MKAWVGLYAMIWLVALEFLLGMVRHAPTAVSYAHLALGLGIVALAYANYRSVRATAVAGRVKRTAQSSVQLGVVMAIAGALVFFDVGHPWVLLFGVTAWGLLLFLHVFLALAIITQVAAVAIAYDMWEEKEFAAETTPGDVPVMPQPAKAQEPRAHL